jgi:signal transduction histidine kinase
MSRSLSSSIIFACGAVAAVSVVFNAGRRARGSVPAKSVASALATSGVERGERRASPGRASSVPDPARNRDHAARDRAEALSRRKQDFLGLLSHELRNPLSAIQVALAVMRARENMSAGQQARTVIERQVAHIARLVEDLVDSARIERGTLSLQLEPLDLRDVLRTAVDMAQPSVDHRRQVFVWMPSDQPMQVSGDRVRLQQVFSNLLLNASKYTPEGGTIELETFRDASDFGVSVRDNGSGIAEADLSKVFEPFVRASRGVAGLGVGLYVARTLVEQHGGEISAASVGPGHGATFTVRLPELSPLFREGPAGATVAGEDAVGVAGQDAVRVANEASRPGENTRPYADMAVRASAGVSVPAR